MISRTKIDNGKDIIELIHSAIEEGSVGKSDFASLCVRQSQFRHRVQSLIAIYPHAMEDLAQAVTDEDRSTRFYAIIGLGALCNTTAVAPLLIALADEDSNLRELAARQFHNVYMRSDEAVDGLLRTLDDPQVSVTAKALTALRLVMTADACPRAVGALIDQLETGKTEIKVHVADALKEITGKFFLFGRSDPRKWRSFWDANEARVVQRYREKQAG